MRGTKTKYEMIQEWRKRHPKKVMKYNQRYRERHREELRARMRTYMRGRREALLRSTTTPPAPFISFAESQEWALLDG